MFNDLLLKITKRFYPKGRAFRVPVGSELEKAHIATAITESKLLEDARLVLDSILPDNPNFTIEDATDWERRLGLISNQFVSFTDRKAAILRKMNHPGTIIPRQHFLYVEKELRDANFNVRVYENRFAASATIDEQLGVSEMGIAEMGGEVINPDNFEVIDPNTLLSQEEQLGVSQMGVAEMGGFATVDGFDVIANHVCKELDEDFFDNTFIYQMGVSEMGATELGGLFDYEEALKSTFFIMGETFPSVAIISTDREKEFRQLVLRLKPQQTVAFLFAEFTGDDYNNDFNQDFLAQL